MAILTRDEILKRIRKGNIKIEPSPSEDQVGPASVDLHISNWFRKFCNTTDVYYVTEEASLEERTELVEVNEGGYFILRPGETCNVSTEEMITLPNNICGRLEGRSRFARLGLTVHSTAGFIQPGASNTQVLELNNTGPLTLALPPGLAVCQIIFEECKGSATYNGRFQAQVRP